MRTMTLIMLAGMIAVGSALAQQVNLPLNVTNGALTKNLFFGLDPVATDGRDAALGENELPPVPPSGVYDVRFTLAHVGYPAIQGLIKDYRHGSNSSDTVKVHRLKFQAATGTTSIIFAWTLPSGVTGRLQDVIIGTLIDINMSGTGQYTLTNFAFTELAMTITYDGPLPIQLSSFTAAMLEGGNVQLDWTTLSETNNYGFEIQKSLDASNGFETIPNSFVAGQGTTVTPHQYGYIDESTTPGAWYYRLKQIDLDGPIHYTDAVMVDILAGVGEQHGPLQFSLAQNFPNPFNPSTTISYSLSAADNVSLKVYNLIGQEVATLVNEYKQAGRYAVSWDASGLASGVYFYKLKSGQSVDMHKLLLMK